MRKSTASRDVFFWYTGISLIFSVASIYLDRLGVAFDYDLHFSVAVYIGYIFIILGFCVAFALGYGSRAVGGAFVGDFAGGGGLAFRPLRIRNKNIIFIILAQFSILSYLLVKFWLATGERGTYLGYSDDRMLGGKDAYFVLLLQSLLPVILWRRFVFRVFSILCCVFVGFAFAWIDSSRAGVIPLASVMIFSALNKKKLMLLAVLLVQLLFLLLAVVGRTFADRLSFDFFHICFSAVSDNFLDLVLNSISYVTAFSLMHFSYVVDTGSGQFDALDLIYSIIPIPSAFLPVDVDAELWRVDQFRPMGAVAELYRVSPVFAFLYFVVIGRVAKANDLNSSEGSSVIQSAIFFLICVVSYQYSLRTVQWYIYGSLLINLIPSRWVRGQRLISRLRRLP